MKPEQDEGKYQIKDGTRAIKMDRDQAKELMHDLEQSLKFKGVNEIFIVTTDHEDVHNWFQRNETSRDGTLPPGPQTVYEGPVYTLAFGKSELGEEEALG